MSTAPVTQPQMVAPVTPPNEVTIISHSTLFYWWPVWAAGYVLALVTFIQDDRMVTVPDGTVVKREATGTLTVVNDKKQQEEVTLNKQDVLVAPAKQQIHNPSFLHMSSSNNLGVFYAMVLLIVIFITNVPLRGLWSVIVIIVIILMSVIFALLGVWETILTALSWLDIRINLGGYLFISTVLLALWLVVFFLFDRQIYMVFSPGNLRVQLEIGDGETTYDTGGMTVQKQRNDLFRHWILGLGSGDLVVRTSGAQSHHFDMPNVLMIGRRVREIEELLRTKQVVEAPEGQGH